MAAKANNFITGYWATEKQWQKLGADVIDRQPSYIVRVFPIRVGMGDFLPDHQESKHIRQYGYSAHAVYNVDQIEGWAPPKAEYTYTSVEKIELVDTFIKKTA